MVGEAVVLDGTHLSIAAARTLVLELIVLLVVLCSASLRLQVKFRVPLPPGVSSTTLLPKLIRTKDVKQLQDGNAQPQKPKLTVSQWRHMPFEHQITPMPVYMYRNVLTRWT